MGEEVITNSVRPSSEGTRWDTRAAIVSSSRGGSPASARTKGTTKSWKVNIAEVGNPGRTMIGLP